MLPRTRSIAVSKKQLHKHQTTEGGFILIIPKSCLDKRGHYTDGFLDGVSVAKQVGMDPREVFKTLVVQGGSEHYVCVIPVECELDLKKAARHFGEKKIEMIPARDITPVTGYIKGGCSPIGMKKLFKTAIANQAEHMNLITVSAGKVGLQVTLSTRALVDIVKAKFADLT